MNIYCNSNGSIFHVDPSRIFQGSVGVNVVRFIGRFPSSAQVLMAYKLPNGVWTSPKMLAPVAELEEIQDASGGKYSVWEGRIDASPKIDPTTGEIVKDENGNVVFDLNYTITENYGTALIQFFVYGATAPIIVNGVVQNVGNGMLATASVSFDIEKGVPAVIPEVDTDDAQALLAQILNVVSNTQTLYGNVNNAVTALQEELPLVAETVFEFSGKDFNFLLKAYKDGTDADSFPIDWFNKTPKVGDRFFGVGVTKDKRNIGFSAEVVRLNEEKNAVFKFLDFVLLGEDYPILNYTIRFTGVSLEELTAYDSATKQYTFVSGEKYSIAVEHFNIPPRVGNNFFGTATVYSTEEAKYPSIISYTAEVTGINSANDVEYKFVDVTVLHKASLDKTVDGLEKNKVDKSGDTMRGPLVFESQGGSGKVEVSDQGIWTSDNGATGTGYADGRIVNKDKTITIPLKHGTMALAEETVAYLDVWFNTLDYQLSITARAADTRILSQDIVDFPLESMVVGGAYNEETKQIELTLQNGNVVSFPVDELVNGLISSSEKGQPNGVASLDSNGKVPKEQLPDDIGGGEIDPSVLADYVKFTDKASPTNYGVVRLYNSYGVQMYGGDFLATVPANDKDIETRDSAYKSITPKNMDKAFRISATTNTEAWTDDETQAARDLIGAVGNTDYATGDKAGVAIFKVSRGLTTTPSGVASIVPALAVDIDNKKEQYKPITPYIGDYFLRKSMTTNTETFTDEEKAAACETIGAFRKYDGGDNNVIYGAYWSGSQQFFKFDESPSVTSFPRRTVTGGLRVAINETDDNVDELATPKKYIDNLPDMLTLTDEQKAKWRAWLGIE